MASFEVEASFVGAFWGTADSRDEGYLRAALEAASLVGPDAIENDHLASIYATLRARFAEGKPTDSEDLLDEFASRGIPQQLMGDVIERSAYVTADQLAHYAQVVLHSYQQRQLSELLAKAQAKLAQGRLDDGGRRVAEHLAIKAMTIYATSAESGVPQTKDEILDDELRLIEQETEPGIKLPWSKLDSACGPWLPGDVIGVSAYSNAGKSTFAANLMFGLARRGVPCIVFPTEMGQRWIARGLAALSGARQKVAEKRRWRTVATPEEKEAYEHWIGIVRHWPWNVVNVPDISPTEILARTRILRRAYPGQTVVVFVDHMHRLNYGDQDPNEAVGRAVKMFKNFAASDPDGLIFVLLFQPRKPEGGANTYRPIAGYQIRGDSAVWNELDVHLSPYRTWVKASETLLNEWGQPKTVVDPSGWPRSAKPNSEGAKLDDEHYYVKVDKDRVGGEGPVILLNFHAPSGRIYEKDDFSDLIEDGYGRAV